MRTRLIAEPVPCLGTVNARWLVVIYASCVAPPSPSPPSPPPPSVAQPTGTSRGGAFAAVDAAMPDGDPAPQLATLHQLPGIAIVESVNFAHHAHGGAAASIDQVAINFKVVDNRPHTITAESVAMLRASCGEVSWRDRIALKLARARRR